MIYTWECVVCGVEYDDHAIAFGRHICPDCDGSRGSGARSVQQPERDGFVEQHAMRHEDRYRGLR